MVTSRNSRSASAARNAATVAGSAGIGWSTRVAHHDANTRASRSLRLPGRRRGCGGGVGRGALELRAIGADDGVGGQGAGRGLPDTAR
jgi:hypothetical protein